jgi:predicted MPP superfamily phosphohydrolase
MKFFTFFKFFKGTFGKFFLGLILVGMAWFVWTAKLSVNLKQNNVIFKMYDWPKELENLKIIHLTDQHFDINKENKAAIEAVEWANKQNPDLIVLTGDYVNNNASIDLAINHLKKLKAKLGVYAVLGDWDYATKPYVNTEKLKACLEDAGIHLLINEAKRLEFNYRQFWLVGIDPHGFNQNEPTVLTSFADVRIDDPKIVLAHTPDVIDLLLRMDMRIDLLLVGHTHGGQVAFPFVGPLYTTSLHGLKYAYGKYEVRRDEPGVEEFLASEAKKMFGTQVSQIVDAAKGKVQELARNQKPIQMYVSSGLGENANFGFRFKVNPEVTLLTLKQR